MSIRTTALAAALGLAAAGCGKESCPTESPQVTTVGNCSATSGQSVSFPVRLCPTCNQTLTSCDADLSAVGSGTIFLNPVVEACSNANSCPPSCAPNPATCTFTAPTTTPGTIYTVLVFDPATSMTRNGTLTIVSSGPSCSLL